MNSRALIIPGSIIDLQYLSTALIDALRLGRDSVGTVHRSLLAAAIRIRKINPEFLLLLVSDTV